MIYKTEINQNISIAEKALRAFHDENKKFSSYKITFEQLKEILISRKNQRNFLRIFGGTINDSKISEPDVVGSMIKLARQSKGKIPSSNSYFTQALVDHATDFSFIDAVAYTAKESASQIIDGAQSVGSTLINTGKILNFLFPIAVVYFAYKFLNKKIA